MDWLPLPADFRASLDAARALSSAEEQLQALAVLAQHRLQYLETIQLDNALRKIGPESASIFPVVRLAVLSSCTIDHLLPAIRVAGLRHQLRIDVYTGPFGQYQQELLSPASGLHAYDPDFVLLSINYREALAGVPISASRSDAQRAIDDLLASLNGLWTRAGETLGATVIQQSILDVTDTLFGSYDRLVPGAPSRLLPRLNEQLAQAADAAGALWLDLDQAVRRDGINSWFDNTRWLQAKIEIAPQSAPHYGELLARLLGAQRGQSKKCLVLDLDNTLWNGVVGDDGIEGIVLGEGSAVGEAHLALQRYARSLNDRGIVLAVCSKNDPDVAEAAFSGHPEMLLNRSAIAAFVANWSDKADNLRTIAEQLNIGLDSLVFVDDNPAERARVRERLPMVAVPELPDDPAGYVRHISDAGYFEAVSFTADDRQRGDQYAANASRAALHETSQSLDDFLRGLDMSVDSGPVTPVDLPRVTQLINKTNQFNTTTIRYTNQELTAFSADTNYLILQFRLIDRFGDNGIVSVMMLRPVDGEAEALEIANWVMSCRVFGRQLEHEAMNVAVEAARDRGIRRLYADFIPTERNGVISDLFGGLGFFRLNDESTGNERSRWAVDLNDYATISTQISRKVQHA